MEGGAGPVRTRRLAVAVAVTAMVLLALELVLARIYPVFLGNVSAFLAIPAAMFGLSLGALAQHLRRADPAPRDVAVLLPILAVAVGVGLLLLFVLFNDVWNLTHHKLQDPRTDAVKTAALLLVLVPAYAVGGALLSAAFAVDGKELARLYAWDLAGSAMACLLVPLLLRGLGLPLTLVVLVLGVPAACLVLFSAHRPRLAALFVVFAVGLGWAAQAGRLFADHPDPDVLGTRYARGREVRELRHAWNEISRVALVRFGERGERRETRLIHDDGISNVMVRPYRPDRVGRPRSVEDVYALAWTLGLAPKRALVIGSLIPIVCPQAPKGRWLAGAGLQS